MPGSERKLSRREFMHISASTLLPLLAAACGKPSPTPLPETPKMPDGYDLAKQEVALAFPHWLSAYVTTEGTKPGQFRVHRPENNFDTVSEGIGYGLLFSVYHNQKNLFLGLWNYAKDYFNQNGLMAWRTDRTGQVLDANSATDADLDMAAALINADKIWGGFKKEAHDLLTKIWDHEIEKNSYILKPGDTWGGASVTNPSYFAPAYFEIFKRYTGEAKWDLVAKKCRTIIAAFSANHLLAPNWITEQGSVAGDMGADSFDFGYNAVRFVLRQAEAVLCFPNNQEIAGHALTQLAKINRFFSQIDPAAIVDGYAANGTPTGQYHNAAFVSAAAVAARFSPDQKYQEKTLGELIRFKPENYYNDSLRLWALLLLSNRFKC